MKKIFLALSLLIFAASVGLLLFLYAGRDVGVVNTAGEQREPAVVSLEPPSNQRFELPPGKRQQVDFSTDEVSFADLSAREWEDQYRDWLLFAAVAALQSSAEDYSNVLYDLPPSRQGYMRPVGNFEFGETRSRFLGGGRVLALIPAGRAPSERKDLLAQIADEQRKNIGGPFDQLIVVEYELDLSHARGALTRRGEIDYATLFSVEYGYNEKAVTKLSDLEEFMERAADLTLARKTAGGLLLGGRQPLSRKYRSIAVEQIATVWQAEQKIQQALAIREARVREVQRAFDARLANRTYSTTYEKIELERQQQEDLNKIREQLAQEFQDMKLVNGSGFSLDPEIDYVGLKQDLEQHNLPLFIQFASDEQQDASVTIAMSSLAAKNIVPLRELTMRIADKNPLVAELLQKVEMSHTYQTARYDGDLQGTETGMILFYTDLLAKLWAIDFLQSSPRRDKIPAFVDHPSITLSKIYEAETEKLSRARLWFGYSNLGFQIAENKGAVLFARNATRIYSAGSTGVNPGVEVETSAFLGAPITWWNDHYVEVARYEPEYERLNQIMKWSVVIGWLNDLADAKRLEFLASVDIDRSNVFPDWVARHPDLKFRRWRDINFFPPGYKGSKTEALPYLSGPVTGGGVSLASKDALRRAPIASDLGKAILRSNLDYAATKGENSLVTLEGVGFKFNKIDANRVSVVASAKPQAKFQAVTAQLARGDVERTVVVSSDAVRVETRLADKPIGDLEIGRSRNGFSIGWRAREIDRAHGLARALSASRDPDLFLLRDPTVETVVKLPGDATYAVKLIDSSQWVKLAPEQKPSVGIADGWVLRAAVDEKKALRSMQASLISDSDVSSLVGRDVVIETAGGEKPFLLAGGDIGSSAARTIEVDLGGGTRLSAWVEPPSTAVHLSAKGENGVDPVLIARRLGSDEIQAIRAAAGNDNFPKVRLSEAGRLRSQFAAEFQERDFRNIADKIAADPETARLALDAQMQSDLRLYFLLRQNKGTNEALLDLDRLIAIHGHQPELTLRRGLVQIERGNAQAAVESAQMRAPGPLGNRQAFFDEVNARFVASSPQAKADLYRYAEYVDWQDRIARSRVGGAVEETVADDHFDFDYRLADSYQARSVSDAEAAGLRAGDIIVYRQDSPSLNSIDWTGSIDQALRKVISGRLGKVSRLVENQHIAQFRPSVIWSPDHAISLKAAQAHSHPIHFRVDGYHASNDLVRSCANDNGSNSQNCDVYLVTAN